MNLDTSPSSDADPDEIDRLVAERDSLAAELAARTEQLRSVLQDLHSAHVELSRLRGEDDSHRASIDWNTILQRDPPTQIDG